MRQHSGRWWRGLLSPSHTRLTGSGGFKKHGCGAAVTFEGQRIKGAGSMKLAGLQAAGTVPATAYNRSISAIAPWGALILAPEIMKA